MSLPDPLAAPFRLSADQARDLAEKFGTPLYVLDETALRARVRAYRESFRAADSTGEITFASKANSTLAVLRIVHQEGCVIDVASEGELRAAMTAGVPASDCHFHGNNKSLAEIEFAIEAGVGQIIIDNLGEIESISQVFHGERDATQFLLRLAPGVDPKTHAKISTGQADTKFGFNIADGSAEHALKTALQKELPVIGFHCHVGSQLTDPEAQRAGGEFLAKFAAEMKAKHGFETQLINVGGGLGIRYTPDDQPMPLDEYNRLIVQAVRGAFEGTGLHPRIAQEPGRALVGEAGVTLYRAGVIKEVPIEGGSRVYVAVDGGLADNPRPALYGSRYTVLAIPSEDRPEWQYVTDGPGALAFVSGDAQPRVPAGRPVTISGRHCETDTLFPDVVMQSDLAEGDLIQVLCTGAYNSSMANNYNRYKKPATVLVRADGTASLVQRRETWDEMFAREMMPEDL